MLNYVNRHNMTNVAGARRGRHASACHMIISFSSASGGGPYERFRSLHSCTIIEKETDYGKINFYLIAKLDDSNPAKKVNDIIYFVNVVLL